MRATVPHRVLQKRGISGSVLSWSLVWPHSTVVVLLARKFSGVTQDQTTLLRMNPFGSGHGCSLESPKRAPSKSSNRFPGDSCSRKVGSTRTSALPAGRDAVHPSHQICTCRLVSVSRCGWLEQEPDCPWCSASLATGACVEGTLEPAYAHQRAHEREDK
jgi:hypothetical protein